MFYLDERRITIEISMKNITDNQKEVRLKDKHGHFLGKLLNGIVYIYCRRCEEFHKVMQKGGEEKTYTLTS